LRHHKTLQSAVS